MIPKPQQGRQPLPAATRRPACLARTTGVCSARLRASDARHATRGHSAPVDGAKNKQAAPSANHQGPASKQGSSQPPEARGAGACACGRARSTHSQPSSSNPHAPHYAHLVRIALPGHYFCLRGLGAMAAIPGSLGLLGCFQLNFITWRFSPCNLTWQLGGARRFCDWLE
jgi:hypothetical protein